MSPSPRAPAAPHLTCSRTSFLTATTKQGHGVGISPTWKISVPLPLSLLPHAAEDSLVHKGLRHELLPEEAICTS
eukprot:767176-Hanusia_phi.AAC.3